MGDLLAVLGFITAITTIGAVLAATGILRITLAKPRPRAGGGNG